MRYLRGTVGVVFPEPGGVVHDAAFQGFPFLDPGPAYPDRAALSFQPWWGFFVGMIIALQMAFQMVQLSAELYIPNVIAVALTRELTPVLTALIVAGRIGAGIAAEIGSMVVTEQVDALKAFAVNPVKYLVVPRFIGLIIMLPVLTVLADLIGIWGGYVICVFKLHISHEMFWKMTFRALTMKDIMTGLIKTIFFGMIIAIVGCHQGLTVKGGADGVGKATTTAVVRSFIMIIMMDCFITFIFCTFC